MTALGRVGLGIAFLLLVLAGVSWLGLVLVAPYFFIIPAIAIIGAVWFAALLGGAGRRTPRPQ